MTPCSAAKVVYPPFKCYAPTLGYTVYVGKFEVPGSDVGFVMGPKLELDNPNHFCMKFKQPVYQNMNLNNMGFEVLDRFDVNAMFCKGNAPTNTSNHVHVYVMEGHTPLQHVCVMDFAELYLNSLLQKVHRKHRRQGPAPVVTKRAAPQVATLMVGDVDLLSPSL
jgi:hypothetical protein